MVPLINNDRRRLAVLALCDMIEKDCTLSSKNNGQNISTFETYIETSIQEFLNDKEYIFSEFLAKICLYTIFEVNNVDCKKWIKQLSEKYNTYDKGFQNYVASFENDKREIKVWDISSEKEKSQHTASQTISNRTMPTSAKDTLDSEAYKQYRELTNSWVTRDIGAENQICLCCKNWTCKDLEKALKSHTCSLGYCTLWKEKKFSINPMCKWNLPDLNRANKHISLF